MPNEFSYKLLKSYLKNFIKIRFKKDQVLEPLFFTFYNTLKCNFSCSYCDFANGEKGKGLFRELDTRETIALLRIIRQASPNIYFTGGEPLLRDNIVDVVKYCHQAGFKSISINTNMSLIHKRMQLLDYITNLVASFDVVDENACAQIFGASLKTVKRVKENIIHCARLQDDKDFILTVNCVVIPETVSQVREVMHFCLDHKIRFAVVPAELDGGEVDHRLKHNLDYQELIGDIIKAKDEGKPIYGSKKYLETILHFSPFKCYPTLTPHIYPNGDLFYPCEPILKVAGNLLELGSYKAALLKGIQKYGPLPFCKNKCYKACYIEPPIFIKNPLLILKNAGYLQ